LENNYSGQNSSADLDTIIESLGFSDIENNNIQLNKLLSCLFSMFIEKSINLTYFSFRSSEELCFDLPKLPDWIIPAETNSSLSHVSPTRTSPPPAASNNLFEKLSTFICDVNDDELSLPNLMDFMEILSMQCRALKTVNFTWNSKYDTDVLVDIIRQQQLKKISLNANNANIDDVIDELVSTQKRSLINIQFENVNFNSTCCTRFFNSLNEFNKLEMLTLIDCHGLNFRNFRQLISVPNSVIYMIIHI
jgi:hypothetical protein